MSKRMHECPRGRETYIDEKSLPGLDETRLCLPDKSLVVLGAFWHVLPQDLEHRIYPRLEEGGVLHKLVELWEEHGVSTELGGILRERKGSERESDN